MIQQAEGTFDVAGVFAGMFVLAAFVILIDALVTLVENRLLVLAAGRSRDPNLSDFAAAAVGSDREAGRADGPAMETSGENAHEAVQNCFRRACALC